MKYQDFTKLSTTEKRHYIENYIDNFKAHYKIEIEESRDLDAIKLDLISALSENEYTEAMCELNRVLLSYAGGK